MGTSQMFHWSTLLFIFISLSLANYLARSGFVEVFEKVGFTETKQPCKTTFFTQHILPMKFPVTEAVGFLRFWEIRTEE